MLGRENGILAGIGDTNTKKPCGLHGGEIGKIGTQTRFVFAQIAKTRLYFGAYGRVSSL